MAFLHDDILDNGLAALAGSNRVLHICSTAPTTATEATTTYTLGNKAAPTVGSPVNGTTNGRKVIITAITDGSVTATGTAAHWALVDTTVTARLLATAALSATQAVTSGNTFSLTAVEIGIPDPA